MEPLSEEEMMNNTIHTLENLKFDEEKMYALIDGKEYTFVVKEISQSLYNATPKERETFSIMPSGYGINWPLIDEDLSIDGLLGITHSPTTQSSEPKNVSEDAKK